MPKVFNITREQLEEVLFCRDEESFDICFGENEWDSVKDNGFHRLRRLYVKATNDLKNYLEEAGVHLGLGEGNL